MLEKLIVGRYLSFKDPKPKITFQIGSFVPQPKLAQHRAWIQPRETLDYP